MRWIARQLFRKEELCPGVHACNESRAFVCMDCSHEFEREDDLTNTCEECGSSNIRVERCDNCGLDKLDEVMGSWAGRLVSRANDFLFAGVHHIPLGPVTVEEFEVMKIIETERLRVEKERADRHREQMEEEH